MSELTTWLSTELERRGWSIRELARRANISHTWIANVLSGQRPASWDFCAAIAQALLKQPEEVFRLASLLPNRPAQRTPSGFATWLSEELDRRGWSTRELMLRSGISDIVIEEVLLGLRPVTWDFCAPLVSVLDKSLRELLDLAGLWAAQVEEEESLEVLGILRTLPTDVQAIVKQLLRALVARQMLPDDASSPLILPVSAIGPRAPGLEREFRRGYRFGFIEAANAMLFLGRPNLQRAYDKLFRHWDAVLLKWMRGDCTKVIEPPKIGVRK